MVAARVATPVTDNATSRQPIITRVPTGDAEDVTVAIGRATDDISTQGVE